MKGSSSSATSSHHSEKSTSINKNNDEKNYPTNSQTSKSNSTKINVSGKHNILNDEVKPLTFLNKAVNELNGVKGVFL